MDGDSYVQRSEKVIITQGKTIIKTPQGGKKGKKKKNAICNVNYAIQSRDFSIF